MSKKIRCIVLFFVMLLTPCFSVCATSDDDIVLDVPSDAKEDYEQFVNDGILVEDTTKKNEKGQIYEGYSIFSFINKDVDDDRINYFRGYKHEIVGSEADHMYFVLSTTNSGKSRSYVLRGSGTVTFYKYYYYKLDGEVKMSTYTPVDVKLTDNLNLAGYPVFDYKISDTYGFRLKTSIPVFRAEDVDLINAYIENGDYSGAVNADDVGGNNDKYTDEYDESIPIPHDFKIIKGVDQSVTGVSTSFLTSYNHDIVLSWTQEDAVPNLQFEIEGNFYYKRLSDSDYTEIQEMNDGFKTVVPKTLYGNSSNSMTCQIGKDTLNGHISRGYQTKVQFRIRNVVGNKTSNWVLVTLDLVNKTASATEQDYYDNSDTGGNEYNDDNVNYDSDTENSVSGDFSINGILDYIKSGFGLLGDNGIITLMSRTYLYLPASIWTIIKFFISMLVAICVIKLIKEVLL